MNKKGFTLIELLIVVAIIAILAAIAVPNFLEAQTRAKISRVKADMRTVATGLEAYRVDSNKYPPDFSDVLAGNPEFNMLIQRLRPLTTPVSYLTSLPEDTFGLSVAQGNAFRTNGSPLSSAPYREGGVLSGEVIRPVVFDYAKFDRGGDGSPGSAPNDNPATWAQISLQPNSVEWALNSPGPDVTIHEYLGFSALVVYDSSNGTISGGQIIRTNVSAEDQPSS